jgi:D-inositol-3-phosphate glycosyltransferase
VNQPEKRRKVAIVGPYPPFRGGIAHFTEQFHLHLHLDRVETVEVSGFSFSRQYPGFLFPGKSQFAEDAIAQIEVVKLVDSVNPLNWKSAAKKVIQHGVDEVVFMYWMPFFAPAFIRMTRVLKKHGVRVSAIVHNASPHERQPFGSFLSRTFLSQCDRLIALSGTVKRDIEALGVRNEVFISHHPVYGHFGDPVDKAVARRRLGLGEEGNLLLFFGLVRKYKGLDILIQALAQTNKSVKLVVAGEWYEGKVEMEKMIENLGLSDRIDCRDQYIPDADVKFYFSAADVLVQPYRNATQSGVVQTAYHFGKPSIVTGVGGLPEMVEHDVNGWVVKPEDSGALAKTIDLFFTDDNAERLTRGAAQARAGFSWESFISNFLK